MACLAFTVVALLIPLAAGQGCPREGPGGSYECIEISRYQGRQWATCLSDAYIRQKSGGTHACEDWTREYCYYQCMLESYNEDDGTVHSECLCDGEDLENDLPRECYSPDGTACSWYSDCLKRKYPCEDSGTPYVTYAEGMCELFNENYDWFSPGTQEWVDKVRKCLQVSLVPYIRDYNTVSCSELRDAAFRSHTPCYVDSGYCQLSCYEMSKVFWTIKRSFIDVPVESLKGLLTVIEQCALRINEGCTKTVVKSVVKFVLRRIKKFIKSRFGRSVDCAQCTAENAFNTIARQLGWHDTSLDWIVFVRETNDTDSFEFDAYIADQAMIRSNTSVNNTLLAESVDTMVNRLVNGDIEVEVDGYSVTQFGMCSDIGCDEQFNVTNVTTLKSPTPVAGLGVQSAAQISLLLFVFCVCMLLH